MSTLTEVGFVEAQQTLREMEHTGKARTGTNNRDFKFAVSSESYKCAKASTLGNTFRVSGIPAIFPIDARKTLV